MSSNKGSVESQVCPFRTRPHIVKTLESRHNQKKALQGKKGENSEGATAPVAATQSSEIKKTEVMNAPIEDPISPVEGEEQLDPYRNIQELASSSVEGEELNSGTSNQDAEDLTCLFGLAMRISHECSSLFIIVINLIFMFSL